MSQPGDGCILRPVGVEPSEQFPQNSGLRVIQSEEKSRSAGVCFGKFA